MTCQVMSLSHKFLVNTNCHSLLENKFSVSYIATRIINMIILLFIITMIIKRSLYYASYILSNELPISSSFSAEKKTNKKKNKLVFISAVIKERIDLHEEMRLIFKLIH